ncbi:MAG: uracil-DNA glycosylase [Zoogloeaceae bacterium]|nr:uracil-DNA glycosylase [Zoogloeaceae bacterium]
MNTRRASILREMGLGPIWRTRGAALENAVEQPASLPTPSEVVVEPGRRPSQPQPEQPRRPAEPKPGVSSPIVLAPVNSPTSQPPHDRRLVHIASLDWDALENDIRACTACRLCESRQQAVPGIGDRNGAWMLVGEGPGAEEDRRGEPFVGAAGQLLDDMLGAIGLTRTKNVYIANAVKCRPPLNRTPQPDEIAACLPYLERQIALVRPKLLIALGRPAALSLLGQEIKINAARGRLFRHAGVPVVVTYHPAYLLRNQTDKGRAWEDLCLARSTMTRIAGDSEN